jgi:hypothetical protein
MSTPLTNIRVFVHWTQQTVFAGEDIECEITFKNIATTPAPSRTTLHPIAANGFVPGAEGQRKAPASVKTSTLNPRSAGPVRGHRTTLSLTAPVTTVRSTVDSGSFNGAHSRAGRAGGSHKRSVSIISIGASETAIHDAASHSSLQEGPRRGPRSHGRSASLQIVPRRNGAAGGPTSGIAHLDDKTPGLD